MTDTIIRSEKSRDNPYLMIHRGFLKDNRLSFSAIGLLVYFLEKPDGWVISLRQLYNLRRKFGLEGRYAINAIISDLKLYGYMDMQIERDEKGRFVRHVYIVREVPEHKHTVESKTAIKRIRRILEQKESTQ